MNQLFKGESGLILTFETGIDTAGATEKKIFAKAPNGRKKTFDPTATGTVLTYNLGENDIDRAGIWKFQSYVLKSGKKYFGNIVEKVFLNPLN
jgi:hypothetical protein